MAAYWARIQPLFARYGALADPEEFRSEMRDVSPMELGLFAAHVCLAEIYNGGLLQMLWNTHGTLAPEALHALYAIGMPGCAATLEEGMKLLGPAYPLVREERWDALLGVCGRSSKALERIFNETPDLYLAFVKVAEPLGMERYDTQLWQRMREEAGGFATAADRFLVHAEAAPEEKA